MENKGHSRTKKSTKPLRLNLSTELDKKYNAFLKKRYVHYSPQTLQSIDLTINEDFPFLDCEFKPESSDVLGSSFKLVDTPSNILSLAKLSSELAYYNANELTDTKTQSKPDKKVYQQAQRKFEQLIKKSKNLKTYLRPLLEISYDDQEIDQLFDESHSIETVLLQILGLTGFSTYETCQLIIHEKGKAEGESIHLDDSQNLVHSQLSAKEFNSLYKLIKKSKHKHFNQTQILDKNLYIVGPFLAKEIDTKEHDLIFIISRNGFLPPTKQEQDYFFSIIPSLKQVFRFILTKSKLTQRERLLASSINSYPFPIIVTISGNIIFKNKHVNLEHIEKVETGEQSSNIDTFSLGVDKEMYVFRNDEADIISDLNHHQRISLLGELLNTLKHELSNPLFGLRLTADLLKTETSDEETTDLLKDISDNGLRCQKIIDNFSDLYLDSRDLSDVDLNFLLKEIITLTKSETRGIRIELLNESPQKTLLVKTQPTWLTQIIFNLIINSSQAIKSLEQTLAQHQIKVLLNVEDDKYVISVKDSGPGVATEHNACILKPYFTTKSSGTGLGLSICQNLAQRLGGHIEYHNNNPSPGATFSVVLPHP